MQYQLSMSAVARLSRDAVAGFLKGEIEWVLSQMGCSDVTERSWLAKKQTDEARLFGITCSVRTIVWIFTRQNRVGVLFQSSCFKDLQSAAPKLNRYFNFAESSIQYSLWLIR